MKMTLAFLVLVAVFANQISAEDILGLKKSGFKGLFKYHPQDSGNKSHEILHNHKHPKNSKESSESSESSSEEFVTTLKPSESSSEEFVTTLKPSESSPEESETTPEPSENITEPQEPSEIVLNLENNYNLPQSNKLPFTGENTIDSEDIEDRLSFLNKSKNPEQYRPTVSNKKPSGNFIPDLSLHGGRLSSFIQDWPIGRPIYVPSWNNPIPDTKPADSTLSSGLPDHTKHPIYDLNTTDYPENHTVNSHPTQHHHHPAHKHPNHPPHKPLHPGTGNSNAEDNQIIPGTGYPNDEGKHIIPGNPQIQDISHNSKIPHDSSHFQ